MMMVMMMEIVGLKLMAWSYGEGCEEKTMLCRDTGGGGGKSVCQGVLPPSHAYSVGLGLFPAQSPWQAITHPPNLPRHLFPFAFFLSLFFFL